MNYPNMPEHIKMGVIMNSVQSVLLSGVFLALSGCSSNTLSSSETFRYGGKKYIVEFSETDVSGMTIAYKRKFLFCGPKGKWTLATSKESKKFAETVRKEGKSISGFSHNSDNDAIYSKEGRACDDPTAPPKVVATGADTAPIVPSGDSFEGGD